MSTIKYKFTILIINNHLILITLFGFRISEQSFGSFGGNKSHHWNLDGHRLNLSRIYDKNCKINFWNKAKTINSRTALKNEQQYKVLDLKQPKIMLNLLLF